MFVKLHMHICLHRNSRYLITLLCIIVAGTTISCNNGDVKNKHPQATMGSGDREFVDENSINNYADSIDLNLSEYEKRESLIFKKEAYSFYVTKYSSNGKPVLYVERSDEGEAGSLERSYYVNDTQLLLFKEVIFSSFKTPRYRSVREYYRSNVLFHAEARQADNAAEFNAAKYAKVEGTKRKVNEVLGSLENAIARKGEFDLTFEGITEYPKARYIILSRDEPQSYRSEIRVDIEDDLIRELVSNTEKYKRSSLDIEWKVKDGEAYYLKGKIKK